MGVYVEECSCAGEFENCFLKPYRLMWSLPDLCINKKAPTFLYKRKKRDRRETDKNIDINDEGACAGEERNLAYTC